MKIVVDTNVLMSGIFFSGPPAEILRAWQKDQFALAVSLEILAEDERVAGELAANYPGVDPHPFLALIATSSELIDCPPLSPPVCADPDDDKFLACALASASTHVVSGDKHLLSVAGFGGVDVIRPRDFVERYLSGRS